MLHTIEVEDTPASRGSQDTRLQMKIGPGYCVNCTYGLKYSNENLEKHCTRNVSSEVNFSSDESLMGTVFKNELHVWKFSPVCASTNTSIELISKATLKRKNGPSNSIRLVALGHNLSIIGYHNNIYVMDYHLHIIMSHSGEVMMEFRRIERLYDWSLCCQIDPLHRFYFMTLGEEWLNNVQYNDIIPATPIVTLHNHHGQMHVEAIQHYKPEQCWRKHRRCFMQ